MTFADRADAGKRLAAALLSRGYQEPLVLALPRGGVPVGAEVARVLRAPLDTIVVHKIGAPFNPLCAVGALAPGGIVIIDDEALRTAHISRASVEGMIAKERRELDRRERAFRSGTFSIGYVPRTVIVVDDGVATGSCARAALRASRARYRHAAVVFAAPVCIDGSEPLDGEADEVVCLEHPQGIYALAQAYGEFEPVPEEAALSMLRAALAERARAVA